jgi:hypothetical protein
LLEIFGGDVHLKVFDAWRHRYLHWRLTPKLTRCRKRRLERDTSESRSCRQRVQRLVSPLVVLSR